MHQLTDNNEFTVRPFDARWEAVLVFYRLNGREVRVRVVERSPDAALAALWAETDRLGYWRSLPPAVRVVSARGAEPCEACGGCGALFNISTIHYLVERCDVCKKFASDHEAGEVVRAASGRGGLAVVVVEAAFEKKGS